MSDLHAYASPRSGGSPSYLDANRHPKSPANDAFEALKTLVDSEKLSSDVLICAGDLGDKADAAGISYAWEAMQSIRVQLTATLSVAVCGNHDLDSRYLSTLTDPDPKGVLQELTPTFPLSPEPLADRFWSRNFVTVDGPVPSTRLLLINSSAYHGGVQQEIDHGRIATRTVDRIRATLASEGQRNINVAVCHHHPFPHKRLDGTPDYEAIKNGQPLIELLDNPAYGPWLLLHGHRHHARIGFAPGSVQPPTVIGAASFSAKLSEAANQVHLIEVHDRPGGADLCGTVTSWTFAFGTGFVLTPQNTNALPGHCGFGYRGAPGALASQLAQYVSASLGAYVLWTDIEAQFEEVRYLNPDQFAFCLQALGRNGIKLAYDGEGRPVQAMRGP